VFLTYASALIQLINQSLSHIHSTLAHIKKKSRTYFYISFFFTLFLILCYWLYINII